MRPVRSGLDGHLVDVVGWVSGALVDPLHRLGIGSLGQAEHHPRLGVGPGVLEVHVLLVLDREVGVALRVRVS